MSDIKATLRYKELFEHAAKENGALQARVKELEHRCDSCEWKKNVQSTASNAHLAITTLQAENEMMTKRNTDLAHDLALAQSQADNRLNDWSDAKKENKRLKKALHDAIRRPMGVVPDSADGLYDQDYASEEE